MIGLLRVKNEARWIARSINSITPICDRVVVLDDHSTDETRQIAAGCGAEVIASPFEGLNEVRDKKWLLEQAKPSQGQPIIFIDGDEALHPDDQGLVLDATSGAAKGYTLRILYLWNDETTVRMDGVYGKFTRPSLFRFDPRRTFVATGNGGGFHCGNMPQGIQPVARCEARLLHYGYMDREDRIRKYYWYNEKDPKNYFENEYRHVAQGDLPEIPASMKLRHAGPLTLSPLSL